MEDTKEANENTYTPEALIKGCWQFSAGHGSSLDTVQGINELIAFADAGITTFDGADIYTGVESLLGFFRKNYEENRGSEALHNIKIHTKFVPDLDRLESIDRAYIESIIDRSLTRLSVEQLDLVQFHWWDFSMPGYVDTARILADIQSEGKIKHLGVTNFDVLHLSELLEAGVPIQTNQVQYSVIDQRPEYQMADFAVKHNIDLLCYGTVAGGFISERYIGKPEPENPLENRSLTKYKLIIDDIGGWSCFQEILEILNKIAQKHNVSIATVASSIILNKKSVASVIFGGSAKHIESMLATTVLSLDATDRACIDELQEKSERLFGDVYSLERQNGGRHASIMKYNLNTNE